jgi:DNA-binding response OmpR family regulator
MPVVRLLQTVLMKRILVVNNDIDSMELLKLWLEAKAYEVKITTNREDVPHIMQEFKPGIVMADIIQQQVIADLKENKHTCNVPVMLMSGYNKQPESLLLNADDIIEKPFNLPLLELKLIRLLKKAD